MDRHNIVIIHSDQHRHDCLGVNGHPFVQTPNIDKLASKGTNFCNAFTPSPICSPARASLLTGAWPHQHGCMSIPDTEIYRPADIDAYPTWIPLLHDVGYRLSWVGKYHQEIPGDPIDNGFDSFTSEENYFQWRKNQGLNPRPHNNWWFGELDTEITEEKSRLAWECDTVLDEIENAGDKPFLVRWDPSEPHLPNIICEPYASMYADNDIQPWPGFDDPLENKPYIQKQQRRTWGVDKWSWDEWRPVVQRYLGEITLLDKQIGRIIDLLEMTGLSDNTLIIYTTDHGDMCGSHGMIDKHFVMYDDVMHVPLVVKWPKSWDQGKDRKAIRSIVDDYVIHEIDIANTVCEAAGVKPPESFEGESLRAIADDSRKSRRNHAYGTWHGGQFSSYTQRMIRTDSFKYIWNASAEDELYDLVIDPAEINNCATDNNYSEIIASARKILVKQMQDTKDIMLNQWTRAQLLENRTI